MKPDTVLKNEGMSILIDRLGKVDAERFIMLVNKEPFDYTAWREEGLNNVLSIELLSDLAMKESR